MAPRIVLLVGRTLPLEGKLLGQKTEERDSLKFTGLGTRSSTGHRSRRLSLYQAWRELVAVNDPRSPKSGFQIVCFCPQIYNLLYGYTDPPRVPHSLHEQSAANMAPYSKIQSKNLLAQ
jgi:hypothetical protein